MDLYSIRNQRISPQKREEFPLLSFCSARAWHSLLAERHTEKKKRLPYLSNSGGVSCMTKSKVEHTRCIVNMQKRVRIHFYSFQFQFEILDRSLCAQLEDLPFSFKAQSIFWRSSKEDSRSFCRP